MWYPGKFFGKVTRASSTAAAVPVIGGPYGTMSTFKKHLRLIKRHHPHLPMAMVPGVAAEAHALVVGPRLQLKEIIIRQVVDGHETWIETSFGIAHQYSSFTSTLPLVSDVSEHDLSHRRFMDRGVCVTVAGIDVSALEVELGRIENLTG